MRVVAVNGSPRKGWNTAALLGHALEGAASMGAETRLVHLYDLAFTGCISCFSCKVKGSTCRGLCAVHDDLRPVLENILAGDGLIIGSPIYLFDVTGAVRCFLERLIFPNISYDDPPVPAAALAIRSALVFTMNVAEEDADRLGVTDIFRRHVNPLRVLSGEPPVMGAVEAPGGPEILASWDTYQFTDYSRMQASRFDEKHKAAVRAERFPEDCRRAYELGARLAQRA